jgi:uncharacterized protein (TIGR03118 family)
MNSTQTLHTHLTLAALAVASLLNLRADHGRQDAYEQVNLVADQPGVARYTDANLLNPWGIVAVPGGRFRVADNHAGVATAYLPSGEPTGAPIVIPTPTGEPGGAATDLAANATERGFIVMKGNRRGASRLLFATEDGTLCGWNPGVDAHSAIIAVDHSSSGAIYKSLAVATSRHRPRLFAANFGEGTVEMYDDSFQLQRTFTDSRLAEAGFAPFGIRVIRQSLFVTFAFKASPEDGDETAGPGLGYVDRFDLEGRLLQRFAGGGSLNAPWGLVLAPHDFGRFGGALLVGNFGDGTVNAFDPHSGNFLGQVSDAAQAPIQIEGLWGLTFGSEGDRPLLYFTAGPGDENHGLLGVLRPVASDESGDDERDEHGGGR